MKKIFLTLVLGISLNAFAQTYNVPAASPHQKIEQQFSVSSVALDYSRPAVKGRKIFGELVPFGKVWRAGANGATKITFGQKVNFGGKIIAAGTYAVYIVPQEKTWKIILNKDANAWGAYTYDEKQDVLDITVNVEKNSKVEYFEMTIQPIDDNTLNLNMAWDTTKVTVPVKVENQDSINKMTEKLKEVKQIEREANKK